MSIHHRQRGNWQSKCHIEDQFHGACYRSGETHCFLYYGEFPWLLTGSYTTGKSCPNFFFTVKARFLVVSWRACSLTGQPFLWQWLLFTSLACFRINLRDLFLWLSVRALPESLNWEEKTLSQRGRSAGAPRVALWLAVRLYCYHGHPPPVSPQAEPLRDLPLGLSSYWVLCSGSQPS